MSDLIPDDELAWENDMYMAQGKQVCRGYDGVLRPFTIPLDVRRGWAARGEKNPYTNRVEVELIDHEAARQIQREWAEGVLADRSCDNSFASAFALSVVTDRPSMWRRLRRRWANWYLGRGKP